jgi:hypothetical protein
LVCMSSSRTLLRKLRTSFTCIKPRFDPSIILLYIAVSAEQYCDITQVNALPENEGILELQDHMRVAIIDDSFVPGKCLHVQGAGSTPRRTGRNLPERRYSGMTG